MMKSIIVRTLACIVLSSFLIPFAYAGDVQLLGLKITHQTSNPAGELFIVEVVISNNTVSTIPGSKFYADRIYCKDESAYKQAAFADTPSIGPGQTHHATVYFPPEQEQYLRLSFRPDRNGQPYAEMMVPRAQYDSKGALLYPCKKDKQMMTPKLSIPTNKLKR